MTGKGDQPVAPLPYQVRATARGIDVGHSQPTVTAKDVTYLFVADVSLGFAEAPVPRWVACAAGTSCLRSTWRNALLLRSMLLSKGGEAQQNPDQGAARQAMPKSPAAEPAPPCARRYLSHFDPLVVALRWRAAGSPKMFDAAFVRGEETSLLKLKNLQVVVRATQRTVLDCLIFNRRAAPAEHPMRTSAVLPC